MKRLPVILGSMIAVAALGTAALAGTKHIICTTVDVAGRYMSGNIASARNSANPVEYVVVQLDSYPSNKEFVSVSMRTASGTTAYCYSSEPALVSIGKSVGPDSTVVACWDASGLCTYIHVEKTSADAPKDP